MKLSSLSIAGGDLQNIKLPVNLSEQLGAITSDGQEILYNYTTGVKDIQLFDRYVDDYKDQIEFLLNFENPLTGSSIIADTGQTVTASGGTLSETASAFSSGNGFLATGSIGLRFYITDASKLQSLRMTATQYTLELFTSLASRPPSGEFHTFFGQNSGASSGAFDRACAVDRMGRIRFYQKTSSGMYTAVGTTAIPLQTRVHLAWVRDGQQVRMYVNGHLEYSGSFTGTASNYIVPYVIAGAGIDYNGFTRLRDIDGICATKAVRYYDSFTVRSVPYVAP